jgi:polyhydroxyalkanoate synthesis regulator protein
MHIVKVYKNRKMYCTETSRYVNLSDLETLFRTIPDVNVIDANGNDITGKTMLAVIANKKENAEDILALSRILRKGNGLLSNTNIYDQRESFDN